ncbi:multicopper oxidase family protein [Streptomyces sp. NBC_01190]|uniref:multicopper oxidase family protein n=1 Tax=Streptomyces sp. NBC_01190 TaxID=2903767 RepID=UPI00386F2308|nr:multicopper oxidase domain-containing protein [Streptomyces sp. NBC_01190]
MPYGLSRRSLLAATILGSGTLATGTALAQGSDLAGPDQAAELSFPSPQLTPYVDQLPVLATLRGSGTLAMAPSRHRFHRDLGIAPTWSYGGQQYWGPTIEAHRDQPIALAFTNRLGRHLFAADVDPSLEGATEQDRSRPRVSVHLHGAVTPPGMDGHPEQVFLPGGAMTYRHPNGQEAAHLWYHDHAMGITRLNVVAGLAGSYLLRDAFDTGTASNPLGLPSGRFEVPLILADRRFHTDGSLNFRTLRSVPQGHWDGGMIGDRMTVNGTVSPYLRVAKGYYRFRVLNASNLRGYHLYFTNKMPFWVIGTDGGLLDAPARTTSVRLLPAERLDLVVDFSALAAGAHVDLTNDQELAPSVRAMTGARPLPYIIRFIGTGGTGHKTAPPTHLRGGKRQPARLPTWAAPTRHRVVSIAQMRGKNRPPSMMLDNLTYDDNPILMPKQGTVELWEIVNASFQDHPMHLHLVKSRIVNRQSFDLKNYLRANPRPRPGIFWAPKPDPFLLGTPQPPQSWEAGLKDTVRCPWGMVTRMLVRFPSAAELGFDPDAAFAAQNGKALRGYVWHCHILDHEDDCMMARFRLIK